MGLDTVEIVLRVEETFGIDLPDVELASVRTVSDLQEITSSCVTAHPKQNGGTSRKFGSSCRTSSLINCR